MWAEVYGNKPVILFQFNRGLEPSGRLPEGRLLKIPKMNSTKEKR